MQREQARDSRSGSDMVQVDPVAWPKQMGDPFSPPRRIETKTQIERSGNDSDRRAVMESTEEGP